MEAGDLTFLVLGVAALALFVGIALFRSVVVVPEHHVVLVERLGRFQRTLTPGRHLLMPRIDAVRTTLDLREQELHVSTVAYAADSVMVSIEAAVAFKVADPLKATYNAADYRQAIEQAVITMLRNDFGQRDSEQILRGPAETSPPLTAQANDFTSRFGIEVTGLDIVTAALTPEEVETIRARAEERLRTRAFTVVLRGYDTAQVDDIMRRAVQALGSEGEDGRFIAAKALREPLRVGFRGYHRRQVDKHFALLATMTEN